jgi:hypothetical protein
VGGLAGGPSPKSDEIEDERERRPSAPEKDERALIRKYIRGRPVHVTDQTMADALFLHTHPEWSQRDLDEADQDIVDLLSAIQYEGARRSSENGLQAAREQMNASHRARIGLAN